MSLSAGTRLGPYEITAPLGSGGMGEVYKARDPRLGRDVAIKVLPPAFSGDAERLHRFEQEARAAAALNHPNILALFDIGTSACGPREESESSSAAARASGGGTPRALNEVAYIVSELLEGESLAERLAPGTRNAGALPARKAIEYAVQIAHGLEAAHGKGIVHRDLKPANIFITTDGRIKILDFGLAKLTERQPALSDVSALQTMPPDTLPGVVLGTVGYMSPEQVRGRPADHRSDIFACGAILYEMLAGHRAFRGETTADTMTAILKEDPPDLPIAERHIPPALARIVDRSIEKNPAGRFQSAGDLAFALEALSSQPSGATEALAASGVRWNRRERLAWIAASVCLIALIGAVALGRAGYLLRAPADAPTYRASILLPEGVTFRSQGFPHNRFALSPDGRRLALVAVDRDGRTRIWIQSLDSLTAQPLPGTEGVVGLFWSPDSRFIAFGAQGKLKKIGVSGGPPVTLCDDAGQAAGLGTWNREDVIVFSANPAVPLSRVSASGGMPLSVTTLDPGTGQGFPVFLPDGHHFLYFVFGIGNRSSGSPEGRDGVYVGSIDGNEKPRLLVQGGGNARYAQGHLLFLRGSTLLAQPFDVGRLALTGDAVPLAEGIQLGGNTGQSGAFTVSDTGVLVYQVGANAGQSQLVWLDRAGKALGVLGDPADQMSPELSTDGTRVMVSVLDTTRNSRDLWLHDVSRGLRTRFTFDPADELGAIWSPDGSRVVFNSSRKGHSDLYQKASNGTGQEDALLADDLEKFPSSWSSDGRAVAFTALRPLSRTGFDLWLLPLDGSPKSAALLRTEFNEWDARFSPDGRWVAYQSNESGRYEVYVAPFPGLGGKWQVSTAGGMFPRWRRDGRELFYHSLDNNLIAADLSVRDQALAVGTVRALFAMRPRTAPYLGHRGPEYDVSADGQRFLVNTVTEEKSTSPLTLVTNWTAGLKK